MVPHFFYNKDGKIISQLKNGRIKINSILDCVPDDAVLPEVEWVDREGLSLIFNFITLKSSFVKD